MSAENIFGLEYLANEHRFKSTVKCLNLLRLARSVATMPIAWHLEKAIAAAEGALAGYGWRDDELYVEATKDFPPGMIPSAREETTAFEEIEPHAYRGQSMSAHCRGWERMWAVIEATYGSTVCEHEGEAWQYMGSFSKDDGATWTHEFRHRSLPPDGRRAYAKVPGTADDFEVSVRPTARRMRVVDRGPFTVRWHDVDTGERGFTARDAWDAAPQAEMIRIAEDDDNATNT